MPYGNVLPNSRSPIQNGVQETPLQNYASPPGADDGWANQDVSSLTDIAPTSIGMLPNHVLSPSVSSGYYIEDGIFEPGSTYQNLFQSLRSHIFRTAEFENGTTAGGNASGGEPSRFIASPSNTFGIQAVEVTRDSSSRDNIAEPQGFQLPPAQEYLLWKAWTEEISIWVCDLNSKSYGPELTRTAGQIRSAHPLS